MGSSKKHDKKKRKRSRSRERERRHKSKKDHDRRKSEKQRTVEEPSQSRGDVNTATAFRESDDDFDIDQLLDSQLDAGYSRKPSAETLLSRKRRRLAVEDGEIESYSPPASRRDTSGEVETAWRNYPDEGNNWPTKYERNLVPNIPYSSGSVQSEVEPNAEGQVQLSLSVSDANKLRAKLGLKPLAVTEDIPGLGDAKDVSTEDTKKAEVFVKTTNIADEKRAEKIKEKLKTSKEKRKITEKLSNVKSLGASDSEDEQSAVSWVKKSRLLQTEKEQAEKRAKLLEEMDAEFGVSDLVEEEFKKTKKAAYTSKHLRGMTVAHDHNMIKEGHDVILTLKDKGVLDEDDDILQNVNLVDEEHYARNIENKKKKKDYVPYEEEYDEFGILQKKNMLSKYDEEIEGMKKKTFTIGSQMDRKQELEVIRMKLKQQQEVSLDMPNMKLANEYYTADDMVQFKRPKKKRKIRRPLLKADDLLTDSQPVYSSDLGSRNHKSTIEWGAVDEEDFEVHEDLSKVVVDEDQAEKELHSALNKARKLKLKAAISAPEKIAVEVMQNVDMEAETDPSKTGPIVLNSTAEFCRTLGDIPTYGMSGNRDEDADELLDFERELMEERQRLELEQQKRGAWNEVDIDETPGEITMRENEPILEEEPDITVGIAGALQLAHKKGYLDKDDDKLMNGPRVSQLQAKSYTIEEKFYEDDKFGKRDRYTGPIQDFREKGSYKPDVKLEYIDDSGRLLNAKEAFRYLSHKFHGKGPGKNKVDKRMKKLDQDTKLKQMSSVDTPLNTVKLLQAKQKETQSPYIVLSGGSKTLTQTMISKPKQ